MADPEKPCPFCDLDAIAGPVTRESWDTIDLAVFTPRDPVTPGHVLVVPVEHVSDAGASPEHAAACMGLAAQIADQYDNVNIITSKGLAATQSVFHLHVHVVPRSKGDGLALPWTGQKRGSDFQLHITSAGGVGVGGLPGGGLPPEAMAVQAARNPRRRRQRG